MKLLKTVCDPSLILLFFYFRRKHKGLLAKVSRERISLKEQHKMMLYETVWACVFALFSGRPSGSVNDLCVCEAEVTAEVISLTGKKILSSVFSLSLCFSQASSANSMTEWITPAVQRWWHGRYTHCRTKNLLFPFFHSQIYHIDIHCVKSALINSQALTQNLCYFYTTKSKQTLCLIPQAEKRNQVSLISTVQQCPSKVC